MASGKCFSKRVPFSKETTYLPSTVLLEVHGSRATMALLKTEACVGVTCPIGTSAIGLS